MSARNFQNGRTNPSEILTHNSLDLGARLRLQIGDHILPHLGDLEIALQILSVQNLQIWAAEKFQKIHGISSWAGQLLCLKQSQMNCIPRDLLGIWDFTFWDFFTIQVYYCLQLFLTMDFELMWALNCLKMKCMPRDALGIRDYVLGTFYTIQFCVHSLSSLAMPISCQFDYD